MANVNPEQGTQEGVFVDANLFKYIGELTEKESEHNKRKKIIICAVGVIALWVFIRGLLDEMMYVINGESTIFNITEGIAAIAILGCGIVYTVGVVRRNARGIRCEENIKAYMSALRVYDKQTLFHVLSSLETKSIKKVFYDTFGNVCVQGKMSKYCFWTNEEVCPLVSFFPYRGEVKITSNKEPDVPALGDAKYRKAILEGETIIACLIKELAPNAPINAYEKEKRNNLSMYKNKILLGIFLVSFVLFLIPMLIPSLTVSKDGYITMVQEACTSMYPDISYGMAFENYFTNTSWDYFVADSEEQVVEFKGNCLYDGLEMEVTMQFVLSKVENSDTQYLIQLHALAFNGISQAEAIQAMLLQDIFYSYAEATAPSEDTVPELY